MLRTCLATERRWPGPLLIGHSGGMDSQALLHAAVAIVGASRLVAVHVHHGLQPDADGWAAFSEMQARLLGVRSVVVRVAVAADRMRRFGLEAAARHARHEAFGDVAHDCGATVVLLAHHLDDQVETWRLRVDRGTGVHGRASMRTVSRHGDGPWLVRPWLGVPREAIHQWALRHRLDWVEDASNADMRHARNRVRVELRERFAREPAALAAALDDIAQARRTSDAEDRQARNDLDAVRIRLAVRDGPSSDRAPVVLSRTALAALPSDRAALVIRLWLRDAGCQMPTRARLSQMLAQVVRARSSTAQVRHVDRYVARYRDRIALTDPRANAWGPEATRPAAPDLSVPPALAAMLPGLHAAWADGSLRFPNRQGAGAPTRDLRHLCQQWAIPPAWRTRLPVFRLRRDGPGGREAVPVGRDAGHGPGRPDADVLWFGPVGWAVDRLRVALVDGRVEATVEQITREHPIAWDPSPEWHAWFAPRAGQGTGAGDGIEAL